MFYEIIVRRSPSDQWKATGLRWPSKTYMVKTAGWLRKGAKADGETTEFKVVPYVEGAYEEE